MPSLALPIFWTLPAALTRGAAAAAAIALINSLGNIGGFVGPYVIGWVKEVTGSFTDGLLAVACGVLLTGVLAVLIGELRAPKSRVSPAPVTVERDESL